MRDLKDPKNYDFFINLLQAYDKHIIVSETDIAGTITYINKSFCKISGYSEDELIGQNHNIVRDPGNDPCIFENFWNQLKQNETVKIPILSNRAKDGSIYYIEATFFPIYENKKVVGYRGFSKDISDRAKLSKLANSNFRLNKKLSSFKDDMIAIFTHELKTPLNAIINFSDYITRNLQKTLTEKKIQRLVELSNKINKNGEVQLDMINTILKVVDIKAGNVVVDKQLFHINDILKPIIHRYEDITQKEIILDIDNIEVYADKKICGTVFTNLYSNAIKHAKSKVLITAKGTKENYKVTVEDDGDGVKEEDKTNIFNMFEQVNKIGEDNVLNRGQHSTGLGLYVVKLLIDICGKQVEVKTSKALGGASFEIKKGI